jgi:uncharacterized protein YdeI (YjbR/CyaY-like superfamily)
MDTFQAMDPRVDAYIENAEEFAKPILRKLRKLVHEACPEAHETIKWSFAAFDYKGPFCSMAAFKEHCAFGFWKASLMDDPNGILIEERGNGMGHLGRISSEEDLPPDDVIIGLIQQAKKLNDDGVKLPPRERKVDDTPLEIPEDFTTALALNILAQNQFDNFPPGKKKEYIEWITEAKADDTRKRRIETALEWISEGKGRNWKYQKK